MWARGYLFQLTLAALVARCPGAVTNIEAGQDLGTAVDAAAAGDELVLADGVYSVALILSKDLTIRALNQNQAVLDGSSDEGIAVIIDGASVVLEGLNITENSNHGVYANTASSNLNMTACNVYDINAANGVTIGAGLYWGSDGILTVVESKFHHCIGNYGGALALRRGEIHMTSCDFFANSAAQDAGTIRISNLCTIYFTYCNIYDNYVDTSKTDTISFLSGNFTLVDCNIYSNSAPNVAGIRVSGIAILTMIGGSISYNTATTGGGLYVASSATGSVELANVEFVGNTAPLYANIYVDPAATASVCMFPTVLTTGVTGSVSLCAAPPPLSPPTAPLSPPTAPSSIPPSTSPSPTGRPVASISGDPHVRGAHGDRFDFKGADGGIYVLLSSPGMSVAAAFKHDTFLTPYSKIWVHGSWIVDVFWTIRTAQGSLLKIHLDAHRPMLFGSPSKRNMTVEGVQLSFTGQALTVTAANWRTVATVTKGAPHWGKLRMSVSMQPLYDTMNARVSPHGLIGQTYDKDTRPRVGKRDSMHLLDNGKPVNARTHAGGTFTTRAAGEGAIDGNAEEYRITRPFSTDFAYSRFN